MKKIIPLFCLLPFIFSCKKDSTRPLNVSLANASKSTVMTSIAGTYEQVYLVGGFTGSRWNTSGTFVKITSDAMTWYGAGIAPYPTPFELVPTNNYGKLYYTMKPFGYMPERIDHDTLILVTLGPESVATGLVRIKD